METAKDDKARRDLERLAERVHRLEGDSFRLVALIAAGVLLLGLLLPYASFKESGEQYDVSLLTIVFAAGGADPYLTVPFLVLLLVVGATLFFLTVIAEDRTANHIEQRIGVTLGWLLLLSAGGAGMMALLLTEGEVSEIEPGLVVYAAGAVLVFRLLATEAGHERWVEDQRADLLT